MKYKVNIYSLRTSKAANKNTEKRTKLNEGRLSCLAFN